jgi:hypothetical protein
MAALASRLQDVGKRGALDTAGALVDDLAAELDHARSRLRREFGAAVPVG